MADAKISFEFFPPKSPQMEKKLWRTMRKLEPLAPEFVSVTYGAGGSTQESTFESVKRIAQETSLSPAAHLTCVGSQRGDIDQIARRYWAAGIRHIVALRGDPPEGIDEAYRPVSGGYDYASDLTAGLKRIADFDISVAAYPERHPESATWDAEIDNLKRKVDAGATQAITQFFIEGDIFLRYLDRVRDAGIDIPIIPGVMLQSNVSGLKRMADMCGVDMPAAFLARYEGLEEDAKARDEVTLDYAQTMMSHLQAHGVDAFHLYTLNKAALVTPIVQQFKSAVRAA